jgi:transposase
MTNAKPQHPNAARTPRQRRKMVLLVINHGWTIESAAERFQVDARTVTKWRARYLAEGDDGLFDRSSRPKTSPNVRPPECRRRIIELRKQRR